MGASRCPPVVVGADQSLQVRGGKEFVEFGCGGVGSTGFMGFEAFDCCLYFGQCKWGGIVSLTVGAERAVGKGWIRVVGGPPLFCR